MAPQQCLSAAVLGEGQANGPRCSFHILECPYLAGISRQRHEKLSSTWQEARLREQAGERAGGSVSGTGLWRRSPLSLPSPRAPPGLPHPSLAGPRKPVPSAAACGPRPRSWPEGAGAPRTQPPPPSGVTVTAWRETTYTLVCCS